MNSIDIIKGIDIENRSHGEKKFYLLNDSEN